MSRGFSIQFDGLEELIAAVETLASGEFMDDLSMNTAEIASFMSRECFENDENPYGDTWKPWKWPPTRPHVKLMIETGSLQASIEAIDVSRSGFTLGSFGASGWDGRAHAHYHQDGTTKMPARKFLPDKGEPDEWIDAFAQEFEAELRELLNA